jgi:hypothetical protein
VVAATVIVRVEVAEVVVGESRTLLGLADAPRPVGGASDRETVPVNPFRPFTMIGEVAEDPARTETEVFTDTVKSTTLTEMLMEWDSDPLVAVTFTL